MCHYCAKQVRNQGIKDSDLPYLPYKEVYEYCMIPNCKGKCKVRDYGIAPYYYWPVKIRYGKNSWRGGWFMGTHGYLCSKHFKTVVNGQMPAPVLSDEDYLSRFVPVTK